MSALVPHKAPIPLWRLLQASSGVVASMRAGQSATAAIQGVPGELRAGAQALAFQAMRSLGRAEALRALLARRAPPAQADALLCTALALCWREANAPYEVFTLVDQTVEAAKRGAGTRGQASFINACLRRFVRERDALVAATDRDPVALWNHPRWWIERVKQDHPRHWQHILEASNRPPPLTLRVNVRKSSREQYLSALASAGIEACAVGEPGVVLARPRPVHEIPGFDEGLVSVQDAAAQLAAPLLLRELDAKGPDPLRILDACAAPGGKTAHLLELADADLTALDVDPARCERIHETLGRLGLQARVVAADAAQPSAWWDGEPFDAILLDAPCTASGIVRRHPDVRWLRRPDDVAALAGQQASLLHALWPLLKPGGRLLYATCSLFKAEGEQQIDAFLQRLGPAQARLDPSSPGHLLPLPDNDSDAGPGRASALQDGFFYALLHKT
jgi:16S rRNA (cytosine967-C5)-methyltransferase